MVPVDVRVADQEQAGTRDDERDATERVGRVAGRVVVLGGLTTTNLRLLLLVRRGETHRLAAVFLLGVDERVVLDQPLVVSADLVVKLDARTVVGTTDLPVVALEGHDSVVRQALGDPPAGGQREREPEELRLRTDRRRRRCGHLS